MQKALSFAIAEFSDRETVIRTKWSEDDDFEELCVHFCWMSEAAETHAGTQRAIEYQRQSDELRQELETVLYRSSGLAKARTRRISWNIVVDLLRRL